MVSSADARPKDSDIILKHRVYYSGHRRIFELKKKTLSQRFPPIATLRFVEFVESDVVVKSNIEQLYGRFCCR